MRSLALGLSAGAALLATLPLQSAHAQPAPYPPYYGSPAPYGTPPYGSPAPTQVQPVPNDYRSAILSQATASEDGIIRDMGEGRLIMQPNGSKEFDALQGLRPNVPVFMGGSPVSSNMLAPGTAVRVYYRQVSRKDREIVGIDLLGQPSWGEYSGRGHEGHEHHEGQWHDEDHR